jgi:hypothetical protein
MNRTFRLVSRMLCLVSATASLCAISPNAQAAPISEQEAYEIGVEAYVYAYPLVTMELTRRQVTNVERTGRTPGRGPMNSLIHLRAYPDGAYRDVVRPNFDTLYSMAWLDLEREPMIISMPDNQGRYYLAPLLDMWSEVFAAPGSRTTGNGARNFAVVAPGWHGTLPVGVERIDAPTPVVLMAERTQTNGVTDYAAVHTFQDGMRVTPLSLWGKPASTPEAGPIDASVDMKTPPMKQVNALTAVDFYRTAARLMGQYAPHQTDYEILARMKRIGLEPGKPFDLAQASPDVRHALERAAPDGLKRVMAKLAHLAPRSNGWMMPTENIGVYGNSYLTRAAVALVGLGANPPEDSVYALAYTDAEGKPLNGATPYAIRFNKDELPPARAFWSVTAYDRDGFPAPNPQQRYALGDRDKLKYDADGSLTLYVQANSPGAALESNWLPVPAGSFNLALRVYSPEPTVLTGAWLPPGVRKAD